MSRETIEHLNQLCLIGFTDKRGTAWHYRESAQGAEPNHYPEAIPVEDVRRRLFHWQAMEGTVRADVLTPEGAYSVASPDRKAIVRPPGALGPDDKGGVLGLFKSGYTPHQYDAWLLDTVANILDDDLRIGSAGLLRQGGVAWVQVEVPESMSVAGLEYRPSLLAATSLDGTLATVFKRVCQVVVCDNTMSVGLAEQGMQHKVKHTRYSSAKLLDIRDALEIVHTTGDDFARQVERLTNTTVTDDQWRAFLESFAPTHEPDGTAKQGRARTMARNKQDAMEVLYRTDNRAAPWGGTAFGVLQAANTFAHHGGQNKPNRAEVNMLRAVSGGVDKMDRETLDLLDRVLA